jgi:hypothetical protein
MSSPVSDCGTLTECDVVCLADKLVQGSRIVSLEARFQKRLDFCSNDLAALASIEAKLANAQKLRRRVEETLSMPMESFVSKSPLERLGTKDGTIPA